jgi:hypothetical protein
MNLIARCRLLVSRLKLHPAQKPVVAVVGGSVVLAGIAMLVLPGPAILVIPMGLAILATEFLWARRWLKSARALLPKGKKQSSRFFRPLGMLIPHRHYLLNVPPESRATRLSRCPVEVKAHPTKFPKIASRRQPWARLGVGNFSIKSR